MTAWIRTRHIAMRKILLSKMNMVAQIRFAKLHLTRLLSCKQRRPIKKYMSITHSARSGENQTQRTRKNASYHLARWWRGDDLGLICTQRTWTFYSHWIKHEPLCTPKYSWVKCEATCSTDKAESGSSIRTLIPGIPLNLQRSGWKRKESRSRLQDCIESC